MTMSSWHCQLIASLSLCSSLLWHQSIVRYFFLNHFFKLISISTYKRNLIIIRFRFADFYSQFCFHFSSDSANVDDNELNAENYVTRIRTKRNTLISSKRPKADCDSPKQPGRKAGHKKRTASSPKFHVCEICNKTFMRKFHLTRHQTSSCGKQSPTSFLCEICGKSPWLLNQKSWSDQVDRSFSKENDHFMKNHFLKIEIDFTFYTQD